MGKKKHIPLKHGDQFGRLTGTAVPQLKNSESTRSSGPHMGYHMLHLLSTSKNDMTQLDSVQQPLLQERLDASMGTLVTQGALLICTPAQEKAPWPPGIGQSAGTQFACTCSGGVGAKFELTPAQWFCL